MRARSPILFPLVLLLTTTLLASQPSFGAYLTLEPVPASFNLTTGGFTVECWVRLDLLGYNPRIVQCVGAGDQIPDCGVTAEDGWGLSVCTTDCSPGYVRFGILSSGTCVWVDSNVSINDGGFHHVAATYDGNVLRIYVDGSLSGQNTVGVLPVLVGGGRLRIGDPVSSSNPPNISAPLDGVVDELRIWSVARSDSEIVRNMNTDIPSQSGLAADWRFDSTYVDQVSAFALSAVGNVSFAPGVLSSGVRFVANCANLTCSASGNPTSGPAPLTVQFSGSANCGFPRYSYNWSFGDGGTSSQQNPSHQYANNGSYTATLSVTDSLSNTCSNTVSVFVGCTAVICSASANPTSGLAPLAVQFTASGSGGCPPYSYSWAFGDGGTSGQQNPTYQYANNGSYTATLTVTDSQANTCSNTVGIFSGPSGPVAAYQGADLRLFEAGPGSGPVSDSPTPSGSTTWLLYPGACAQRAAGTWAPHTAGPAVDNLNTYDPITQNHGYQLEDQSLKEILWHIDDGTTKIGNFPLPINGARSLWCGKTDPNWVVKSGYPNLTYQILYFDTDLSAAGGGATRLNPYTLSWSQYLSNEFNYDYMYVIGGSGGSKDPIGDSRAKLDAIISSLGAASGDGELLVTFTGCQITSQTLNYTPGGLVVRGSGSADPSLITVSLANIPASDRAIYLVFISDGSSSNEDGLWPSGHGCVLDDVMTSDQGALYTDQTPAGGTDGSFGNVLVGTPGNPLISARVAPGVGTLWQVMAGNNLPTSDFCSPQKNLAADIEFMGADATLMTTIPNTFASIRSCTLPLPASGGTSVRATWSEYVDLPRQSGFVQYTEYRVRKLPANWGNWGNARPAGGLAVGALQAWITDGCELPEATQADSVQLRFNMACINFLAVDHVNCQPVTYGVLYDDFNIQVTSGVPKPTIGLFSGSMAQSTFVDGTDPASANCTDGQITGGRCWPGIRGSSVTGNAAIHDNFNSPQGDSIVVNLVTGLRRNGMGINWKDGFDKSVNAGLTIVHTNSAFNPAYDVPRCVYRLFDPRTLTWSPWDSTELDADACQISGADTIIVNNSYRMNWPPRDKIAAGASLPGGFSINDTTAYSQLAFLPKGCRMQYYFKAVDINGGVTHQFSSDHAGLEVEDLPTLPGSSVKAPDIMEFDVLPRVYQPGAAGTLLAGKTNTPILNLDGAYSAWSVAQDPVTQALRAMGVRVDRYRFLQGLGEGNNIGGHELLGQRQDRMSNYFPNIQEYGILATLANQYRIIIQSSHLRDWTVFEEQDAKLIHNWWNVDTGLDGGDRCIFASGDDFSNALLNSSLSLPQHTEQVSLAQDVFGVASCLGAWSGTSTNAYPTITDNFAGITYPLDGGCPSPNRFDGLNKVGSPDATVAATYPGGVTELAGVARATENDGTPDNDRSKAVAYGYSIQFIRTAGIPTNAANYVHSGVQNRMAVLFKFLTSCRGQRTPSQTTVCWPCPSNLSDLTANWAAASGFNTAAAGPLYPIQDNTLATGVPEEGPGVPAYVNALWQNRPNPFNPETVIPYSMATPGKVTIRIFNVAGQCIRTLVNSNQTAGPHVVRWNGKADGGRATASGVFFYRIIYPDGSTSAKKMAILR